MECSPAQTSLVKTRAVASTSLKLLVLHVSWLRDIYSCTFLKWKNVCSVYICSLSLVLWVMNQLNFSGFPLIRMCAQYFYLKLCSSAETKLGADTHSIENAF